MKQLYFLTLAATLCWIGCGQDKKLPYLGNKSVDSKGDSIYHRVGNFSFINQNGDSLTEQNTQGKVYIADFFFTSCPTICPKVKKQMKRVYDVYKDNPDFLMLSHSIDTKYDTVGRLAWYGQKLNIKAPNWHLLTGDKAQIYKIAYDYLLTAIEDEKAEGGFDHSGAMALIDRKGHIRGMYDGLDEKKVDLLIEDIALLLKEK